MPFSDEPVTLRASFGRYYLSTWLPLAGALMGGTAVLLAVAGGEALGVAIGWVAGGVFGTFLGCGVGLRRARVELREGWLDVPGLAWRRLRIPVERIDRGRSSQRTFWQRVAGERSLWTLDGERVILNERWFAPGALMELWVRLGCLP